MARETMPGTVQIRVLSDAEHSEELSRDLVEFLKSRGMEVIDCTPDFVDRYDPTRRKFHIVAIPGGEKHGNE